MECKATTLKICLYRPNISSKSSTIIILPPPRTSLINKGTWICSRPSCPLPPPISSSQSVVTGLSRIRALVHALICTSNRWPSNSSKDSINHRTCCHMEETSILSIWERAAEISIDWRARRSYPFSRSHQTQWSQWATKIRKFIRAQPGLKAATWHATQIGKLWIHQI